MKGVGTKRKAGIEGMKVQRKSKGKIKEEEGVNQIRTLLRNGHHDHPWPSALMSVGDRLLILVIRNRRRLSPMSIRIALSIRCR